MVYSEGFKSQMVRRMTGPHALTATALCGEVGIAQGTLSRWLREASTVAGMKKHPNAKANAKRPSDWSPEEKFRAIEEVSRLAEDELGAFLRRKGLHQALLEQWRETAEAGAVTALAGKSGPTRAEKKEANKQAHRMKRLENELNRKEKALAEAAALLVLKKKLDSYYGAEDDGT